MRLMSSCILNLMVKLITYYSSEMNILNKINRVHPMTQSMISFQKQCNDNDNDNGPPPPYSPSHRIDYIEKINILDLHYKINLIEIELSHLKYNKIKIENKIENSFHSDQIIIDNNQNQLNQKIKKKNQEILNQHEIDEIVTSFIESGT